MKNLLSFKNRLIFTGIITAAIWALLGWNFTHGGVPSHHILADENLPSISNWWGVILLPLLTWFLLFRIQKRLTDKNNLKPDAPQKGVVYAFLAALFFGILLSVFFMLDYADLTGKMLMSVFLLALFFPVYRSEYLLGFVLGMTFTFGAILPTGIGSLLCLIAFLLFRHVRTLILYLFKKITTRQP